MNFYKILKLLTVFCLINLALLGCKKIDWGEDAVFDGTERARKNVEEGRGFTLGKQKQNSGVFNFATSNELWRASIDTLNFITLANVDYSGGIIITDWYSENNSNQSIKITIQFFSNEIRADGLDVLLHKKICDEKNQCSIKKIDNTLSYEIKETILKKAALMKEENETKDKKKGKKKKKDSKFKEQKVKTKSSRK